MKKHLILAVVILAAVITFHIQKPFQRESSPVASKLAQQKLLTSVPVVTATPVSTKERSPNSQTTNPHEEFTTWLAAFDAKSATPESIVEGQRLATARRPAMVQLMRENPKAALEQSVSLHQWEALPESIRAQVEKPISIRADYDVISDCRPSKTKDDHPMDTRFVRGLGTVHVFGQFKGVLSKQDLPLQGISLDGEIVPRNEVLQVLNDQDATAARRLFPEGNPADESLVTEKKSPAQQ